MMMEEDEPVVASKVTSKAGVLYLSRVPPFMKPAKVKHLLGQFGEVSKLYLAEEDASLARRRKRETTSGTKKRYVEGWIEFASKKIAKSVAASLNNTPIGGRGFYSEDVWNLKYLSGFKWEHLTEKRAYERRVREQKLKVQVADAQKTNSEYLSLVEQRDTISGIEKRKRARGGAETHLEADEKRDRAKRSFAQNKIVGTAQPPTPE